MARLLLTQRGAAVDIPTAGLILDAPQLGHRDDRVRCCLRDTADVKVVKLATKMRPTCDRQAPERGMNTKGGESRTETVRSDPAGSTPVRQRRSPPAGSESCMGGGNVIREA